MPPAIAWGIALIGAEIGSAVLVMYATEIATAAIVLGGLAYSSAKAKQAKQQARDQYNAAQVNRMVNVASSVTPRELVLGRVRKGGAVFYKASTGTVSRNLYLCIALAGHEIDAIEQIYLNDVPVTLDVDGQVLEEPYWYPPSNASYVRIYQHLGGADQVADPHLLAAFPEDWSSTNTVAGVAYLVVHLFYSETAFPSGVPNVTAVVRGAKLFDPRHGTTAWSENPALMMRHVYAHPRFGKAAPTNAEDARFIAAANACDTSVAYTVGSVAQPTCALYRAGIVAPFGTQAKSLLDDLSQAMGGSWAFAGGELYLKPGVYSAPVMSLTDADLAVVQRTGASESQKPISIGVHKERAQKFNTVKATIWDAAQDYKQTVLTDLVGAALVTRDGVPLVQEVTLPAVGYAPQALHICGIMMRDARDALVLDLPVKLRAYPLELFDTISLTLSRYGWSAKTFMVLGRTWNADGSIQLTLKETAAAITQMDSGFLPQGYAANTNLPNPWRVGMVGPLTVSSGAAEMLVQSDGSIISRMRVSWPQINDAAVVQNGQIEVQYRAVGSTGAWASLVTAGNETTVVTSNVQAGTSYTVRARGKTSIAVGEWSSTVTGAITGKTSAPAAVTAQAVGGMFMVQITWAFGDSAIDILGTEIWWSSTNNRTAASRLSYEPYPGTSYQHVGLSVGQGGYYWLRVGNTSGVMSAWYPSGGTNGLYSVASSDPSSLLAQLFEAIGVNQLSAGLASSIGEINALGTSLGTTIGQVQAITTQIESPTVGLEAQAAGMSMLALALQQAQEASAALDLGQLLALHTTATTMRDAGIVTDPVTGHVRITGVEQTATSLTQVMADFDAMQGVVTLQAQRLTQLNTDLVNAQLDPTGAAVVSGVITQINDVQQTLDAVNATLTQKASSAVVGDHYLVLQQAVQTLSQHGSDLLVIAQTVNALQNDLSAADTRLVVLEHSAEATTELVAARLAAQAQFESLSADALAGLLTGEAATQGMVQQLAYAKTELRADVDTLGQSVAQSLTNLTTVVDGNRADYDSKVALLTTADTTEATARQTLAAKQQTDHNTVTAAVQTESSARAAGDSAIASQINTLTASLNGNVAALQTEASTRATADSALSSQITTLTANVANANAAVQTESSARVAGDSAQAQELTNVQASLNGSMAALSQRLAVVVNSSGQVVAAYTLALNANGRIVGVRLDNNGNVGNFVVQADKFAFVLPGQNGEIPVFVAGVVNGVNTFGINGQLVVDGTIYARHLNVTNLAAITANLGNVTAGTLAIDSDGVGGWGYVRSGSKWWHDGTNGWVFAKHPTGPALLEFLGGACRFRMSSWGDCSLDFPGISMSSGGLTINQANVINTLQLAGNAVTVPFFASAGSSSYGSVSCATQQQFLTAGSSLIVTATYTVTHGGFHGANITLQVNGVTIASSGFSFENNGNGVCNGPYIVSYDGWYTVTAIVSGEAGGYCTGCFLTGLGAKK